MELRFPHKLKYYEGTTSIDEVIANLQAQKKLIEASVVFLCRLDPALSVEQVEITVLSVEQSSLITEMAVLLYAKYQENIEGSIVEGYERLFGIDIPEELEVLVTLATLAVAYWVARFAYEKLRGAGAKAPPASTHIEGDYNTVINVIGSKLHIAPARVEQALLEGVPMPKRRALIRSVGRFFRPREDERPSAIAVAGYGEISKEVVAELPSGAELAEFDDSRNVDLANVRLDIRATDRDSHKHWAGKVIGDRRFKKRLPMDIYPTVDVAKLAEEQVVIADLMVEGETTEDGKFKPKRLHLLGYRKDA